MNDLVEMISFMGVLLFKVIVLGEEIVLLLDFIFIDVKELDIFVVVFFDWIVILEFLDFGVGVGLRVVFVLNCRI